jgi:type I restriction enzyme S subunit
LKKHFKKTRLSELGEITRGVTYKSPDDLRPAGSPRTVQLLRATNIQDGAITLDDVQVIDEACAPDRQRLATGDIAICIANGSRALVGKAALVDIAEPDGYVVGAFCARFRPLQRESSDLIAAIFESQEYRSWIDRLLGTTTINNLKPSDIADCPIMLPTEESGRRRLGAVMRTSRNAIRHADALIAAKREQKRGLMQQLLTGKVRFPGFTEPWKTVRIGDLLEETRRPVEWNDEHIYQLVSIRRRNGGLFLRECLAGSAIASKSLFVAKAGDLLISRMQVVHGAIASVPADLDGSHISAMYLCLTPRSGTTVRTAFVDLLAHLPAMHRITMACSHGVHIEKMTFDPHKFMTCALHVPSTLAEQDRIIDLFTTLAAELNLMERQREALATQRRGLMERLLSGEIDVPSSDNSAA